MSDGLSTGETLALGGGVLTIVGALLPWVGPELLDGAGLELNRAIIALLLGIVISGLVYVADWTETAQLLVMLFGAVTIGIAGYTLLEAGGVVGDDTFSVGLGLYVTLLAGVLVLAGGAHGYTDSTPEAGMYSHR